MTREQLDAIRARVDNARYRHWLGDKEALLNNAMNDLLDLLAEVERLTAEIESKVAQNAAMIRVIARHQAETDALRSEIRDRNDANATAFQRGVAAMRETAAITCALSPLFDEPICRLFAAAVRDLPDPEDTP